MTLRVPKQGRHLAKHVLWRRRHVEDLSLGSVEVAHCTFNKGSIAESFSRPQLGRLGRLPGRLKMERNGLHENFAVLPADRSHTPRHTTIRAPWLALGCLHASPPRLVLRSVSLQSHCTEVVAL